MPTAQSRREFLTALLSGAAAPSFGSAALLRAPQSSAAEPPPETTAVRLFKSENLCVAPQFVAEELLRAEGFPEIGYLDVPPGTQEHAMARGEIDIGLQYAWSFVAAIDAGEPLTLLSGGMVGCVEVFAKENIRGIADLKGGSVGVPALGGTPHKLVTLMAADVGLDPAGDIRWVTPKSAELVKIFGEGKVDLVKAFEDGKIDAYAASPPTSQGLRARHVGHVIVNTGVDRPWSQYFCCLLGGNRDYVRNYPVSTKRVLRAILKAADLCADNPTSAAQRLVDGGFTQRYSYALQTLSENGYKWREYDPEDTVRFYALRLRETGFIKSSPQKIIAEGTNWRFLDELKRELKA
jgi:NitT/TauT family transport system substrate-binding protein